MVYHVRCKKKKKRTKRKKEVTRCVIRKQIPALTTKCTRMSLEISQQRIEQEYIWNRIASGNLFEEGPGKDEVALLVKGNLLFPKDMTGLETLLFLLVAGFPSFLPFLKKRYEIFCLCLEAPTGVPSLLLCCCRWHPTP